MEFFLENPFILIAIIAAISSLFKKAKGQERPNTNRPKPIVENRPVQEVNEQTSRNLQPKALVPDRQTIQTEYLNAKKEAEAKIAALKEQQKRTEAKTERISSVSRLNTPSKDRIVSKVEEKKLIIDKDKLADAVIWSEIIGPPRAKKPHRSMNIR